MSKYIYASAIIETAGGKLIARAFRFPKNANLVSIMRIIEGKNHLLALNIKASSTDAVETAHCWEDGFISNGDAFFARNYVTKCFDL